MAEQNASEPPVLEPPPPAVDLLDWVLFVPFLVAFLMTLLVFDLVQRTALCSGWKAHERAVAGLNSWLLRCLKIVGTSIEYRGCPPLPPDTPAVIISNHQSLFDISVLAKAFSAGRPRFVAKRELGKWIPSVSINLRAGGNALIDREDPRQAIPELKRLAALAVERRFATVIFPEGTRARRGVLKTFHHAGPATLLGAAPEMLVVPVVIDGTWKLSARPFGPIPRGVRITVSFLPPIERNGRKAREIVAEAEGIVRTELERLRGCATVGFGERAR